MCGSTLNKVNHTVFNNNFNRNGATILYLKNCNRNRKGSQEKVDHKFFPTKQLKWF